MPISSYYRDLRQKIGPMAIFNPSVAAIIRNHRGDILFQRPQGSIELGETPARAVVREVYEETGLRVKPVAIRAVLGGDAFRFTYPDDNQVEYVVVIFDCKVVSGELRCLDGESAELRYFSFEECPPLALPYPEHIFQEVSGPTWFEGA